LMLKKLFLSRVFSILWRKGKAGKFRSLTFTLTLAFVGLSSLCLVFSTGLSMYKNYDNTSRIISNQQQLIAKEAANTVQGFLQEKLTVLVAASNIGNLDSGGNLERKTTLEKLLGTDLAFRQVAFLNTGGKEVSRVYRASNLELSGLTGETRNEILTRVRSGENYIGTIYIDDVTFEPMVLVAVPVNNVFREYRGSLIAEVNLKFIWDLVSSIKIGKHGHAYVVDRNGGLLAFQDIGRVLKGENLRGLKKVAQFINDPNLSVEDTAEVSKGIEGNTVVSTYLPLVEPDWAVVIELPYFEAYSSVLGTIVFSSLITVICLFLAFFAGKEMAKRITKPVIQLRDATDRMSKGNLDINIDVKSRNELGDLADNFNQMIRKISALIANVKRAVRVISEQSSVLEENSRQSAENMSAIAVAIQEISQGTMEQSVETEKSSNIANKLVGKIDMAVTKLGDIERVTKSTKHTSISSQDAVEILLQRAKETDEITKEFIRTSTNLDVSMEKIRRIMDVITGINEQTNLLALNASIEAARAGEAGRGFAVVASEINKLANQSQEATATIRGILNEIQSLSSATVETSSEAHQIVGEQMMAVTTVNSTFTEVNTAMDNIIQNNLQMIDLINNINEFKEQTARSIMSISTISEQSASSSQEVLAISEEQTVFTDRVKDLSKDLHDLADDLVKITDVFVVKEQEEEVGA